MRTRPGSRRGPERGRRRTSLRSSRRTAPSIPSRPGRQRQTRLRLRGRSQSARTLLAYQVGTPCPIQILAVTLRVEDQALEAVSQQQAPPVGLRFGNEWKEDIAQFRRDAVRLKQP